MQALSRGSSFLRVSCGSPFSFHGAVLCCCCAHTHCLSVDGPLAHRGASVPRERADEVLVLLSAGFSYFDIKSWGCLAVGLKFLSQVPASGPCRTGEGSWILPHHHRHEPFQRRIDGGSQRDGRLHAYRAATLCRSAFYIAIAFCYNSQVAAASIAPAVQARSIISAS